MMLKESHRFSVSQAEFVRVLALVFWPNLSDISIETSIYTLSQLGLVTITKNLFETIINTCCHLRGYSSGISQFEVSMYI